MSMLWLHYEYGWPLAWFDGSILARLFGKDPQEALETAKQCYDKDTVSRWMSDQPK